MSVFDIKSEIGMSRILITKEGISTPLLVKTQNGLESENLKFHQIILSDRGYLPLSSKLSDISNNEDYDLILDKIPEWSILTPRLYPAGKNLEQSLTYELNLYLERISKSDLPNAFGLIYDPLNSNFDYLSKLIEFNPSIIVLRSRYMDAISPRAFLESIIPVISFIPPNIAIYVPGSGGIGYQTVLIGLGVSIVDDSFAYRLAAKNKILYDGMITKIKEKSISELVAYNLNEVYDDFKKLNYALSSNNLWSKMFKDMHVSPNLATYVKLIFDKKLIEINIAKFPTNKNNILKFIGDESLYHPDVLHYQKRLIERYNEEEETKLIILLPCSAKKPYQFSRSHHDFEKAIKNGSRYKRQLVSVWSLTSPLGVVPQNLETIYPAMNYDIPVTGNWSSEEIKKTGSLLSNLIKKTASKVKVIAHVSKDYSSMINYASKLVDIEINWCDDAPRTQDALNKLSKRIEEYLSDHEPNIRYSNKKIIRRVKTINSLVEYTHDVSLDLLSKEANLRIIGRPPRPVSLQLSKQNYVTWDSLNGKVTLHKLAINEIYAKTKNWILVNTDELKGSNLFGIGVHDASTEISPGDEVIFFNKDKSKVLGNGFSKISGISMKQISSGIVASIKNKIK